MDDDRRRFDWLDLACVLFLVGLALLPPIREIHKQLTLLAIAIVQLLEGNLISHLPGTGRIYSVLLKLLLATLLLGHTSDLGINSSYYPIYYLPIITAAVYFGTWATLAWTFLASALYCSFLLPVMQEYELTVAGTTELAIRILFFFVAAIIVNRFAVENRSQMRRYRLLSEELATSNRELQRAQADARRSERLAALGQMSAGLAHEIRNPLGVIKGSAEMLSQKLDASNPLALELAGYISTEVNRLSLLVTRFLDFARPLHAETTTQSVLKVLDHSLDTVAARWHGAPVKVERTYSTDLPEVPVDENLLEQAFVNLIQNSYEAMNPAGGGTLCAYASRASSKGRRGVEIRLQDTGPGIPTELREQIFNPFVTTKDTGVGLGLSIVSKIIDGHHGSIRLDPQASHGAHFVIFLPLQDTTAEREGALAIQ
jgi:signal transduction histidine kinase